MKKRTVLGFDYFMNLVVDTNFMNFVYSSSSELMELAYNSLMSNLFDRPMSRPSCAR